jgi:AraC family transcriptional regulator, regulatory protein of adaptative response / DNA-3-methyladenine glycosylase II
MRRVPRAVLPRFELGYRAPYDWEAIRDFFRLRAVPGIECVEGDAYLRTVRSGEHTGWIRVAPSHRRRSLVLEISPSLRAVRRAVVAGVRRLFDLDADPAFIGARLSRDPRLARLVKLRPGLRVPRAFDASEIAARAVLGQQVTVAAARTLAGRLARATGDVIATPFDSLDRLWPTAARLAALPMSSLVSIPLTRARASALSHLMSAIAQGRISLAPNARESPALGASIERTMASMVELPGIGPWTANYIAMRGLAWSDAFPEGDIVLRKALGGGTARACRAHAERWRPFRAYAALHLWASQTRGST